MTLRVTGDAILPVTAEAGEARVTGDALLPVVVEAGEARVTGDALLVVTLETPPIESPSLADAGGQHYPDDGWAAAAELGLT